MTLEEYRRGLAKREAKYTLTEKVIEFMPDVKALCSELGLDQVVKFDKEGNVLEEGVFGIIKNTIKMSTLMTKATKAAMEDGKCKKAIKNVLTAIAESKNPHKVSLSILKPFQEELEQFYLDCLEEDARIEIACKKLGIKPSQLAKKFAKNSVEGFAENWNNGSEKDHLASFEKHGVKLPKALKEDSGKDFFKKGFEVSKNGAIAQRTNANDANPEMVKMSPDGAKTQMVKKVAASVKRDDPKLFDDMTKEDDINCDIRQSKKDPQVVGIFADGEEDPRATYTLKGTKVSENRQKMERSKRIRENMNKRLRK